MLLHCMLRMLYFRLCLLCVVVTVCSVRSHAACAAVAAEGMIRAGSRACKGEETEEEDEQERERTHDRCSCDGSIEGVPSISPVAWMDGLSVQNRGGIRGVRMGGKNKSIERHHRMTRHITINIMKHMRVWVGR